MGRGYQDVIGYQKAALEFVKSIDWQNPKTVTLTMKQRVADKSLDGAIASLNFRHFMNRLNRKLCGNNAARRGQGLKVFPVLEHDESTRLHYHAAIDCRAHVTPMQFDAAVRSSWSETAWGYHQIDIGPMKDTGWIDYMAKIRTKADYDLAFDWMNTRTA